MPRTGVGDRSGESGERFACHFGRFGRWQGYGDLKPPWAPGLSADFSRQLEDVNKTIHQYEVKLNEHEHHEFEIGEPGHERDAVARTYKCLASIEELTSVDQWYLEPVRTNALAHQPD